MKKIASNKLIDNKIMKSSVGKNEQKLRKHK